MHTERPARLAGTAVLAALALIAPMGCSSDDDAADPGDPAVDAGAPGTPAPDGAAADPQDPADEASGAGSGEDDPACPEELFTGTIERVADDDLGHTPVSLTGDDITDGVGYELLGAYTVYLADHEIDRSPLDRYLEGSFSFGRPGVGGARRGARDDGHRRLRVRWRRPPRGGRRVRLRRPRPPASWWSTPPGVGQAMSPEPSGTIELLGADDERVCVAVDYADGLQAVQGTVSVPLYEG